MAIIKEKNVMLILRAEGDIFMDAFDAINVVSLPNREGT